ncbi:hypothetical protein CP082626L3_1667, partial [Chlamydia psittaci 08-2626_L3]
MPCPVCPG